MAAAKPSPSVVTGRAVFPWPWPRERLLDAKAVEEGRSPAQEKQREKRRQTFAEFTDVWMEASGMADSTKAMRKHVIDRDILPAFKNRPLMEISPDDLRALCMKVKKRGAPATAINCA